MNWGSKVESIDSYRYETMALEGKKIRAFAVVLHLIYFQFRQVQLKTLQVRCGLASPYLFSPIFLPQRTCKVICEPLFCQGFYSKKNQGLNTETALDSS